MEKDESEENEKVKEEEEMQYWCEIGGWHENMIRARPRPNHLSSIIDCLTTNPKLLPQTSLKCIASSSLR